MPLLDNSYNMLTGQFLSIFEPAYFSSDYLSNMLLSGISNTYTLILAIIYAVIACALFTIRKVKLLESLPLAGSYSLPYDV